MKSDFPVMKGGVRHPQHFVTCGKLGALLFTVNGLALAEGDDPIPLGDEEYTIGMWPRRRSAGSAEWPPKEGSGPDVYLRMLLARPEWQDVSEETEQLKEEGFFDGGRVRDGDEDDSEQE